MSDVIKLSSGRYFSFDNPEGFDYRIEELAHSLGMLCRFTGHTSRHYSVAQHSVVVSYLVPAQHAKAALLHDVHEALTNDLASPFKRRVADYRREEARVEAAVLRHFSVPLPLDPCVKLADTAALLMEQAELFPPRKEDREAWPRMPDIPYSHMAAGIVMARMSPEGAREMFLWRWREVENR